MNRECARPVANLAMFDFDGTVTVTDTFLKFLRYAVPRSRIVVGSVMLSPVGVAYKLGRISAPQARPWYARAGFQGRSVDVVSALGCQYAREVLPGLLQRRALDRIRWHKEQGDDVVIVSASLDVYLRPWCAEHGLPFVCTELEQRNGRYTGRYFQGDCSGPAKAQRVMERYRLDRYSTIYAYGDTGEDREMLALAHKKYFRWREIADLSEVGAGVSGSES